MSRVIICDVGGVLVITTNTAAHRAWEARFGIAPGELHRMVYDVEPGADATIGRVSSQSIWLDIASRYNLNSEEMAQLIDDFSAGDVRNDRFYSYLGTLRGHMRQIILSNAWDEARDVYTNQYHLDRIFDSMILSAEVHMQKPDRDIFEYALKTLGVKAPDVIYIDDTPENIQTGLDMGMNCVLFSNTHEAVAQIESLRVS